jgi:hypothetical protein
MIDHAAARAVATPTRATPTSSPRNSANAPASVASANARRTIEQAAMSWPWGTSDTLLDAVAQASGRPRLAQCSRSAGAA